MALTSEERIQISGKIVAIPFENAQTDTTKATINVQLTKAQQKDSANKKLCDNFTTYIDSYQGEATQYDGSLRTVLTEQHFLDSAARVKQNPFYPNDTTVIPPSLSSSSGIWTKLVPFARGYAVGKNYVEVAPGTINGEQTLLANINTAIATVESFSNIIRSTGQHCIPGDPLAGTCSIPAYTDQVTCEANLGVWTPAPTPDQIVTFADMQNAGTALKNAVIAWQTSINTTYGLVCTFDTDPTKSAQNSAAKSDITNSQGIISTWQSLTDYDTSHGQTTCIGFNAYNYLLLGPTKFRSAELLPLKNEITARLAFVSTRTAQLATNLGSVTQDMNTGDITASSGLYGTRYGFIQLRLNSLGGSLSEVNGLQSGINVQDSLKTSNNSALTTYSSVIKVSMFRAAGAGTGTVHVMDGSLFSIGDSVFVCGTNLEEISCQITGKDNNTLFLNTIVSAKYTRDVLSRVYKVLV